MRACTSTYQVSESGVRDGKNLGAHVGNLHILPSVAVKRNDNILQEGVLLSTNLNPTSAHEEVRRVDSQVLEEAR